LRRILQLDLNLYRIAWTVFSKTAAEDAVAMFNKLRDELKISAPDAVIIQGIEYLCKADEAGEPHRKEAAIELANSSASAEKGACADCKLRLVCPWLKQKKDHSSGLKIYMHAHISTSMPGFPKSLTAENAQIEKDGAPIFGIIVDEDFLGALDRNATIKSADLPSVDEAWKLAELLQPDPPPWMRKKEEEKPKKKKKKAKKYKTFREWLRAVKREEERYARNLALDAETIGDAIRTAHDVLAGPAGRIPRKLFEPLRGYVPHDWRERRAIDVICENLQRLIWHFQKAATTACRDALKAGNKPNIAELLKPARQMPALHDLFELVCSATEGDREEVYGTEIVRVGDEPALKLGWMRRWPDHLFGRPLLLLDATAKPIVSRLPFAFRDDGMEYDAADAEWNPHGFVEYHHIKVHAPYQILMKVIGAKAGKRRFDNVATELVEEDGKRKRVLKTEKGADGKTYVPRMRRDSHWSELLRLPYAVAGRALAMGQTAGFNSYKLVIDYIKKTGTLQNAIVCNWPGVLRGSNTQEEVDVLINECALMLHAPDLEREAEKIFAMDPKARPVQRGLQMQQEPRGLRVKGGGGIEIDTPVHSCPQVQMVFEYKTVAEEAQINGRARAIRRGVDNPVLIISVNDIVDDNIYDIVVDYDAFEGLDDIGAVLHAQGVISSHAPHLYAMAREVFESQWTAWAAICKVWTGDLAGRTNYCPDFSEPLLEDPPIRDSKNPRGNLSALAFGGDNVLFGQPSAQNLLAPAALKFTTYKPEGYKRAIPCALDTNRPIAQIISALEKAVGRRIVELDGVIFTDPPKRRGRKPKPNAKPESVARQERRNRQRERQAAPTDGLASDPSLHSAPIDTTAPTNGTAMPNTTATDLSTTGAIRTGAPTPTAEPFTSGFAVPGGTPAPEVHRAWAPVVATQAQKRESTLQLAAFRCR
jgi:hypothetical protein